MRIGARDRGHCHEAGAAARVADEVVAFVIEPKPGYVRIHVRHGPTGAIVDVHGNDGAIDRDGGKATEDPAASPSPGTTRVETVASMATRRCIVGDGAGSNGNHAALGCVDATAEAAPAAAPAALTLVRARFQLASPTGSAKEGAKASNAGFVPIWAGCAAAPAAPTGTAGAAIATIETSCGAAAAAPSTARFDSSVTPIRAGPAHAGSGTHAAVPSAIATIALVGSRHSIGIAPIPSDGVIAGDGAVRNIHGARGIQDATRINGSSASCSAATAAAAVVYRLAIAADRLVT